MWNPILRTMSRFEGVVSHSCYIFVAVMFSRRNTARPTVGSNIEIRLGVGECLSYFFRSPKVCGCLSPLSPSLSVPIFVDFLARLALLSTVVLPVLPRKTVLR